MKRRLETRDLVWVALVLGLLLAIRAFWGGEGGKGDAASAINADGQDPRVPALPEDFDVGTQVPRRLPGNDSSIVDGDPRQTAEERSTCDLRVVAIWETGGAPASDIIVDVHFASGMRSQGTTDGEGYADFPLAEPGPAFVLTGSMGSKRIELEPGHNNVRVRLDRTFSLIGTVTDPSGGPIPAAQVSLHSIEYGQAPPRSALTRVDGSFEVRGPRLGSILRVVADGFVPEATGPLELTTLVSGGPLDIVLRPSTARVEVMVNSAGDGPLEGVTVRLIDAGPSPSWVEVARGTTDGEGLTILAPVGPGSFRCTAVHPNYAPATAEVEVRSHAGVAQIVLELDAGFSVVGRVQGASLLTTIGKSVVTVASATRLGTVDADGLFRIDHIPVGRNEIVLRNGRGAPLVQGEVVGALWETVEWNPPLPHRPSAVAGTVVVEGERELDPSAWRVIATCEPNRWMLTFPVATDRSFRIPCETDAVLSLGIVHDSEPTSYVDSVSGIRAGSTDVRLNASSFFERDGRVTGHFVGAGTRHVRAVVLCRLFLEGQSSTPHPVEGGWVRVDDDGGFALEGLRHGNFALWAIDKDGQAMEVTRVEVKRERTKVDLGEIPVAGVGAIDVVVVDGSGGYDLAGLRFALRDGNGVLVRSGQVPPLTEGRIFHLDGVQVGPCQLEVSDHLVRAQPLAITVLAERTVRVEALIEKRAVPLPPPPPSRR